MAAADRARRRGGDAARRGVRRVRVRAGAPRVGRAGGAAARCARRRGLERAPPPAACERGRVGALRRHSCRHGAGRARRARVARLRHERHRLPAGVPRRAAERGRVARLRDADEAAHHVATAPDRRLRDGRRAGRPAAGRPFRRDDSRARARVRRRQCAQSPARPRHRPADGDAHRAAAGCRRAARALAGARVRAGALGLLVRAARRHRERAERGARAARQPLLRRRLHALAEALDTAEHRDRRRSGCRAAARRLRRRKRPSDDRRAVAVRDRLPLDAAPFLGAGAPAQGAVRSRVGADAARRARSSSASPSRRARSRCLRRRSTS